MSEQRLRSTARARGGALAALLLAVAPLVAEKPGDEVKRPKEADAVSPASDTSAADLGIELVRIPAGKFVRGSTAAQLRFIVSEIAANEGIRDAEELLSIANSLRDETPARWIEISRPFEIGKTEITQEQYLAVMGENPSRRRGEGLPANSITYGQAVAFCRKLSELTGEAFRLPTEAEWEYACRAGTNTIWSFGDDPLALDEHGWHEWNAEQGLMPVARAKPNAWGLHDMLGNVAEWCSDFYDPTYYADSPAVDPTGPAEGKGYVLEEFPSHVSRGGSAYTSEMNCRPAGRAYGLPIPQVSQGFRIVRELPKAAEASAEEKSE